MLSIAAINRHHVRQRKALFDDRKFCQFFFGNRAGNRPQVGEQQRRVNIALMIGGKHIRLSRLQMFPARHMNARAKRPNPDLAAKFGIRMHKIFDAEEFLQHSSHDNCGNSNHQQQQNDDKKGPVETKH